MPQIHYVISSVVVISPPCPFLPLNRKMRLFVISGSPSLLVMPVAYHSCAYSMSISLSWSQCVKIRHTFEGSSFAIADLQMAKTFWSLTVGRKLALKSKMQRARRCGFELSLELNLCTQSTVGMRASFKPGVSIRLKTSSSWHYGAYVTPLTDRPALNLPSAPARRFINVDFPWPIDPSTITVGLFGFAVTCDPAPGSAYTIFVIKMFIKIRSWLSGLSNKRD